VGLLWGLGVGTIYSQKSIFTPPNLNKQ